VISVDTKKKELVGDFENPGRQWRHKGRAPRKYLRCWTPLAVRLPSGRPSDLGFGGAAQTNAGSEAWNAMNWNKRLAHGALPAEVSHRWLALRTAAALSDVSERIILDWAVPCNPLLS
jgi:hypothetical protein